jgi:polyisoprenyl-phosphate glycosyltransferase
MAANLALSIVTPLFNEEGNFPELYRRLTLAAQEIAGDDYELIFVNDGSRDQTISLVLQAAEKDSNIKYISFSRNFGHQIAVTAGLDASIGKAVVIIDGDLQDPPEIIPTLFKKHQEGYEVVYGKRTIRKGDSFFKKFTAKWFYRILRRITSIDIPLDTGDFRLIDRKIVEALKLMPEQNKFLRGQIAWLGFRQTYVEFERDERLFGTTGYPLKKMLKFAMDGITAFSDKPLQMVTNAGLIVSFIAFLVMVYALYSYYILERTMAGWTSLILSTMFIGGIQLISIGIIGEYISRINNNVRNRPLYVIDKTNI